MDLNRAKILIEKINSLHKSMGADVTHISAIEKDLMKSYVRQLYEVVITETSSPTKASPKVEIIKSTPKPTTRKKSTPPPKPVELEVIVPDEVAEIEEIPVPAPPKPVRTAPRVIAVPDSLTEYKAPVPTPTPKPVPPPPPVISTPPVAKPTPPPPPPPAPKPASTTAYHAEDEEMEELFEQGAARELSEKLSNLPIRDLKKAMGLNEKIFTMNELFGGNQPAYDATIDALNGMRNFDEAKEYLVKNIAAKYGWVKSGRKKKAQNFIKLVRRRYA